MLLLWSLNLASGGVGATPARRAARYRTGYRADYVYAVLALTFVLLG